MNKSYPEVITGGRETETLTEDQDGAEHEPEGVEVIGERGQIAEGGGSGRIGGGGGHGGRRVLACARRKGVCVSSGERREGKKKKGGARIGDSGGTQA